MRGGGKRVKFSQLNQRRVSDGSTKMRIVFKTLKILLLKRKEFDNCYLTRKLLTYLQNWAVMPEAFAWLGSGDTRDKGRGGGVVSTGTFSGLPLEAFHKWVSTDPEAPSEVEHLELLDSIFRASRGPKAPTGDVLNITSCVKSVVYIMWQMWREVHNADHVTLVT